MNPADHCFREDSPTNACRDCGEPPEDHTGCDCDQPTGLNNTTGRVPSEVTGGGVWTAER